MCGVFPCATWGARVATGPTRPCSVKHAQHLLFGIQRINFTISKFQQSTTSVFQMAHGANCLEVHDAEMKKKKKKKELHSFLIL